MHGASYERFGRRDAEVIAETAAFVAASSIGLETDRNAVPYVAHWADADIEALERYAGAVDDMSGLMTQLRAVAEVQDGRPAGFRLFRMQDDSIFRRLGLQNGDVVKRVNGQAVSDPANLLAFLQRLRSEPRVAASR